MLRLDYYTHEELTRIITRSAGILNIDITPEGAAEIACRSRGTPRIANRLLRRCRDYAQVRADGVITLEIARQALRMLDVDEVGLDEMDLKILKTLVKTFEGGPVGLQNLAVAIGEEAETIEEVYEPFLIQEGFLKRTSRGRTALVRAYQHLNLERQNTKIQETLFNDEV